MPPLVLMIIMGCVARNTISQDVMSAFPNQLSQYIRSTCLSIVLTRGGMTVAFKGMGLHMVTLVVIP